MTASESEERALTRNGIILLAIVGLLIAGLAVLVTAWMGAPTIAPMPTAEFQITGIQFEEGYLNITVKNTGANVKEISQVAIETNNPKVPEFKAVAYELVPAGGQISFSVSYEWIPSGSGFPVTYQVKLTDSLGYVYQGEGYAPWDSAFRGEWP